VERVKPRLQHANSAVVLSATKVIIRFLDVLTDSDKVKIYAVLAPSVQTRIFSPEMISSPMADIRQCWASMPCLEPKMKRLNV
jgi:vesicle coat complex subunit